MSDQEMFEKVLVALRQIIRSIDLHSRRLVQNCGLTGPQLIVLRNLGQKKEMTVGELAKLVNLSPATVTGVLDRLTKRDLVQRTRDASDKRRVIVQITRAGRKTLKNAPSLLQEHFMTQFTELQEWEQTLVLSSIQRVAAMMETEELASANLLDSEPVLASTKELVEIMPENLDVARTAPSKGKTHDA